MRKTLQFAIAVGLVVLALVSHAQTSGQNSTQTSGTQTGAKTAATKSAKAGTKAAAAKKVRKAAARPAPIRSRQQNPTPDRYKEIQQALAAKGYLAAEQANGEWTDASADALRRFQADQNLDPTGKINSLSLIALGLGPKYDTAAAAKEPPASPAVQ